MKDEQITLADCPVGLFWHGDELCLKTEYGSNEGRIDAYIVSTGEFFWGGATTVAEQRVVKVTPYDHDAALASARAEGMREAAGIVDACSPPGEADSWTDGYWAGLEAASAAILSAIGDSQ